MQSQELLQGLRHGFWQGVLQSGGHGCGQDVCQFPQQGLHPQGHLQRSTKAPIL